jgi:hypothetical protein
MSDHRNLPCANCLARGKLSASIDGWTGAPICREHVAKFIGNHAPKIDVPESAITRVSTILQ